MYDPNGTPGDDDDATLWEFDADLSPCVPVWSGVDKTTSGWVSIRAMGTDSCVFSWAAHDVCGTETFSIVWDSDTEEFYYDFVDWSLCLTGEQGFPLLGACCNETTGSCTPGEIDSCNLAGYRFEPYTACAEMDPPCGVIEGACCDPASGMCSYLTADECTLAGGTFIAHGSCYPNVCPQPDPCEGPDVIYSQTPYDSEAETIYTSVRNYGGYGYIAAADVLFESPMVITDLHWWAASEECFNWSGFDDILIFADVMGEPGTVDILNPGPYPDDNPYYDIPNYQAYYNGVRRSSTVATRC